MSERHRILIEGLSADEIMALSDGELASLVMTDEPIVFNVGSAELLGRFRIESDTLVAELGHIDGGGEGVLPLIWLLCERYARRRGLSKVEWLVHALTCAKPNPKLGRILKKKGFEPEEREEIGPVYRLVHRVPSSE